MSQSLAGFPRMEARSAGFQGDIATVLGQKAFFENLAGIVHESLQNPCPPYWVRCSGKLVGRELLCSRL